MARDEPVVTDFRSDGRGRFGILGALSPDGPGEASRCGNFDTPGPRRRGGDASAWLGFSAAKRSVAFSMPDGFIGGRGGRPFRRRISSLSCWFSSLAAASAAFCFSFSSRSRSTSPINRRTSPTSSVAPRPSSKSFEPGDIPSLNHTFKLLTPPSAREFAPVTFLGRNPLKSPDSEK